MPWDHRRPHGRRRALSPLAATYDNEGWIGRLTVASRDPILMWEYRPHGEAAGILTNRFAELFPRS